MKRQQNVGQEKNIQRFALLERRNKFFHTDIISKKNKIKNAFEKTAQKW